MDNNKLQEIEVNAENSLRMLNYFQKEWLYRHKHYWSVLTKTFTLNIIITLLPFITTIRISELNFPIFFFPIVGFFITIISYIITTEELQRLGAINDKKREINESMASFYRYKTIKTKRAIGSFTNKVCFIFQFAVELVLFIYGLVLFFTK